MAEVSTQSCDECGILRKDANHWFRAFVRPGVFTITGWDEQRVKFVELRGSGGKEMHLCSESCAVKAMCKAIGAGS